MGRLKSINVLHIVIILSPLIIGILVHIIGEEYASVGFLGPVIIGIPLIALIGNRISKSTSDKFKTTLGYLVPATICNLYGIYLAFPFL